MPGVESGVENENGLVDGATDDPAVAVVESAGEGAAVLLGVPKLNGFASGLGVKPPKGFAEGVADPNPNVGLGVSASALVFAAGRSKMFEARPSGMGDGVGVASGMAPAPNEPNVALGFRGEGGTAGGVAAGVSSGRLEPKVGLVDGRLSPNGEGFGAGTEGAAVWAEPKEKGEDWAASFVVVEVEEPKPKVGLDSIVGGAGLGASGAGVMGFGVGAETFAFFAPSKSLTTFCRCSLYCEKNSPISQNVSFSTARFADSMNAWFSPRNDVQYVSAAVESEAVSLCTGELAGSGVG